MKHSTFEEYKAANPYKPTRAFTEDDWNLSLEEKWMEQQKEEQEGLSKGEHTPGPWELQGPKIQEDFGGQTYWTIKPNPYKSKAIHYSVVGFFYPYSGNSKEQQIADAELMASAPQLKAENERLRKIISNSLETNEKAIELIGKLESANKELKAYLNNNLLK